MDDSFPPELCCGWTLASYVILEPIGKVVENNIYDIIPFWSSFPLDPYRASSVECIKHIQQYPLNT